MKQTITLLLALLMTCLCALPAMAQETATQIVLSDEGVTVDGAPASTRSGDAVYTAHDIVFYLAGQDFTYGEGTEADAHTQEEADAHTVVHITQPGTYALSGRMSAGQIAVDIDGGKKDESAVVTLVLNGVDITTTVGPSIIFYNVYECSSDEEEDATMDVDLTGAGANVVIADGTVNSLNGSYVARIYQPDTVELSEDGTKVKDARKLHKYDGVLYSKRSMNLYGGPVGDGVLNITAENEGLCSDLHLAIHGGNISITAGNDGINTSEDNVSVAIINGGNIHIDVSGETGEGDGIDSNGWIILNGGSVTAAACGWSMDAGVDADRGIYVNGGSLCATGHMLDHISGGDAACAVFAFAERQKGGSVYTLKDADGETVAQWTPANDFTYLVASDAAIVPGEYTLWQGEQQLSYTGSNGMGFGGGMPPMAEGFDPANRPEPPEGFDPANRPEPPEGFDPANRPEPPEGFDPANRPEPPEGFDPANRPEPPDGFDPANQPEPPKGFGGGRDQQPEHEARTGFLITEEGGSFSGVAAVN